VSESRRGLAYAALASGLWGVVAAYWKLLGDVDPIELIAHRAVWALVTFGGLVVATGQTATCRRAMRDVRVMGLLAVSSVLLAINWALFVWATVTGHLLEASLGYFINPLVSVALGTLLLRERPSRLQWGAIVLAAAGVGVLTWNAGEVPLVALALAGSWGLYGLVRKRARVDALVGSTIETVLIAPIAVIYLAVLGGGVLATGDATRILLIAGTGVVTAVPLMLFTSAAKRLPLSTLGLTQYLAPTAQFLLAVVAYGEPLAHERLAAFGLIWAGLVVFSVDLWRRSHQRPG
jgi:chloramphenicol-sensitive protein RarD